MSAEKRRHRAEGVALQLLATAPRIRGMVTSFLRDDYGRPGLNIQEFDLLRYAEGIEIRMSDLASLLAVTPSAVTKIVDRLVANRLVARFQDRKDRRVNRLRLTRRGRGELERLRGAVAVHLTQLTDPLPRDELDDLAAGLDGLLRVMDSRASRE